MQADLSKPGEAKLYPNMRAAFSTVYHKEGLRGLYDGWKPNALRAACLTGVQVHIDQGGETHSPLRKFDF